MADCVFCFLPRSRVVSENDHAVWIWDDFPVSPGHALIITKRHVASYFEVSEAERLSLLGLLDEAKEDIAARYRPDGYNIGINDGRAAGQTVPHLHLHLIPRYFGDRTDPRGGVRWVIPDKANYWTERHT